MKQKMKQIKQALLCGLLIAGLPACNDSFDTHYAEKAGVAPEATLWQLIEQDPSLSEFAAIVKQTGYDVHLATTQAFTVWAPINEALQGLDKTDESKLKDIVATHIARFKYTADSQTETTALTINAKRIRFSCRGGACFMNEAELETANRLASNGILHTMKEQIPFVKNIWEYMTEPGMDSIRNYFNTFNTRVFYPGNSTVIDYKEGMAVYDSVFFETNTLFYTHIDGVGFLNNEDSIYSMIMPANAAWIKAYEQRKPYFETSAPNADSLQHWNTQYAIVRDLVFRGRIDAPGQRDSMISTRGNVFHNPAHLFPATPASAASNGWVYITDELKHEYWESWQHSLLIEAETTPATLLEIGVASTPAKVVYAYLPDKPDVPSQMCRLISNGNDSRTESTFLLFDIPNTLKAKYEIYAVFAPVRYLYPSFTSERTKIRYDIQQLDRTTAGKTVDDQVWNSLVGVQKGGNGLVPDDPAGNETDSIAVKKMLLTTIDFPEANYGEDVTTIRLKLIARITAAESRNGYNNRMLLDGIILEPVKN
jgi:hypothetical protein